MLYNCFKLGFKYLKICLLTGLICIYYYEYNQPYTHNEPKHARA